jgi:hypothetical protein
VSDVGVYRGHTRKIGRTESPEAPDERRVDQLADAHPLQASLPEYERTNGVVGVVSNSAREAYLVKVAEDGAVAGRAQVGCALDIGEFLVLEVDAQVQFVELNDDFCGDFLRRPARHLESPETDERHVNHQNSNLTFCTFAQIYNSFIFIYRSNVLTKSVKNVVIKKMNKNKVIKKS